MMVYNKTRTTEARVSHKIRNQRALESMKVRNSKVKGRLRKKQMI
jgi:hypothetical protein